MKEYMRFESDSIGTMEVPEDAYYGVQALRAKENFPKSKYGSPLKGCRMWEKRNLTQFFSLSC